MLHNRSLITLLVLVAMLVTVACQPITAQSQPAAPPSDEDVVAAVNAIWDEYEASVIAGDVDRWIAQWTEDGVQMPPGEPFVEGKEKIYARVGANMAAGPTTDFVITPLETTSAGDWAYSRGVYTVTFPLGDSGEEGMIDGKFMTILKRQPDGAWKIHRDIYNSNVPPAAPPEPDVAAVTAEIDALFTEYGDSLAADDAERWIQLWVEDGVQLPPGTLPNVGRDAILASISGAMEHYGYRDMDIQVDEVLLAGDLAIARGMYTVTLVPRDGSQSILVDGKYTTTFQRQPDGSLKIYRDIFNSNVPPDAGEADIAALSAELHQRFSDNDLEGAAQLADQNIKMIGYGLGLDLEGREQFLQFMQARKRAFPDIRVEHTNLVVQGDQVVVEFVATGTHTGPLMTPNGEIAPTGKPVTLHVVEIHTWKDGKLVNIVQYQDPTSVLRQNGVME
ncbi:MAG: nuclear transport factor 2 family protein [Caldilineaceae bacterium]